MSNMSYLKLIVLGGDDANWVNKGVEELPLDGFHLSRSCKRGWENGMDMYRAIREGRVRMTLGKLANKEREHVYNRGTDWRKNVERTIPEGSRGLGCMEISYLQIG